MYYVVVIDILLVLLVIKVDSYSTTDFALNPFTPSLLPSR